MTVVGASVGDRVNGGVGAGVDGAVGEGVLFVGAGVGVTAQTHSQRWTARQKADVSTRANADGHKCARTPLCVLRGVQQCTIGVLQRLSMRLAIVRRRQSESQRRIEPSPHC